MPTVQIPESSYGPLTLLAEMEESQFNEIVKSIAQCSPQLTEKAFIENIASKVSEISKPNAQLLIREIYSLINLQETLEVDEEEVSRLIAEATLDVKSDALKIPPSALELLKTRIQLALSNSTALRLVSKARDVTVDHDRAFLKARVFTDLRPVFDKDATDIMAASIVHMVAIHYDQNEEHKEFYVALDDNDVEKLVQALQRAQRKSLLLRKMTEKADVTYIGP